MFIIFIVSVAQPQIYFNLVRVYKEFCRSKYPQDKREVYLNLHELNSGRIIPDLRKRACIHFITCGCILLSKI